MRAPARRLLALTVAFASTGAGALSLAPGAQAAACGGATGVTVVVDFGTAGAGSIGCASGDPATGLAALTTSGHSYVFVPRQPGFVCTIDATPNPCNNAPTNAYWSYWHAQRGGSWSYGTVGAGSYNPAPGSVDGWSFGSGNPPSPSPPAAVSAPPPASGTTTTGSVPAGRVTVNAAPKSGSVAPPPGVKAGSKAANSPAAAPTTRFATPSSTAVPSAGAAATGTPTTAGTATALGGQTQASANRAVKPDGGGDVGGLALGVGLVALLGGVTGYLAWRRRAVRG